MSKENYCLTPKQKAEMLAELKKTERKLLMIGVKNSLCER